jgi:N-methylhydantoinase A
MTAAARATLAAEHVAERDMEFAPSLDMRYVRQYHEVNVPFDAASPADVVERFHVEHDRLYGYQLREEKTPVEVINLRLRAVGRTPKPTFPEAPTGGTDASAARKGARRAWVPERARFEDVPAYDGERVGRGMRIEGPALVDQTNTSLFLSADYDLVCDRHGNFLGFKRDRADALPAAVRELLR